MKFLFFYLLTFISMDIDVAYSGGKTANEVLSQGLSCNNALAILNTMELTTPTHLSIQQQRVLEDFRRDFSNHIQNNLLNDPSYTYTYGLAK